MAFNELYSEQVLGGGGLCGQDGPSNYWSYFTGTGQVLTSSVLSLDGSKVAFVENAASGAILRILKWKSGEGSGAGSPAPVDVNISGSPWSACTAGDSCMASITFSGAAEDTNSAPFYDYTTDVLYVGDNAGVMHKFTGVFLGTPTEVTTSPWPITVDSGAVLTGPVFDSVSLNLFVGDSTGQLSFIRETGSTVGLCVSGSAPCLGTPSVHVGTGTGGSVVDAPIVDGSTGRVLAFNSNVTCTIAGTTCNTMDPQPTTGSVLQTSTALVTTGSFDTIGGNGVACNSAPVFTGCAPIYGGAFDNAYLTSSTPTIAGHMYVCGKNNADTDRPVIYQFSFAAATGNLTGVGTPLVGLTSGSTEACSPVTEIYNSPTSTDWIFFSVGNLANSTDPIPAASGCRTGSPACLMSINVTSGAWPPTDVTNAVVMPPVPVPTTGFYPSSTSGIVVDNYAVDVSASPQTSSIYFSYGGNSSASASCNTVTGIGCAVKLTQSALE